ncbi:DUF2071 domain-containing protein [Algivirga pacifica]|uniref:DUF2071 domain-containing protein n=1 Tax=Algivirga pacifica TaxID=1162670 RepID=A0ABP9DID1_9BACT
MSFLTAEWKKLAFANYIVPPETLQDLVPEGTELDFWEGNCYVSLVGFMFQNTKLLGLKIPFHTNFEEVNLRFYVKRKEGNEWKRGVVFIKEIVPKRAITFVANQVYKENYETMKMSHHWEASSSKREIVYRWKCKNQWQSFQIISSIASHVIEKGSEEEFITEHYWGYAHAGKQKTNEYEVKHPQWELYEVHSCDINVNFGLVYGEAFSFLNNALPSSVMLAEGSEISVESKRKIKEITNS